MIFNQFGNYQKDIGTAKHALKFSHKQMQYLPPGIHLMVTPAAIELVREQDLLFQKHQSEGYIPPCTGSFTRIHGLPCYHEICRNQQGLQFSHFNDDHWRYQRQQGQSLPPRPYEHIREPRPAIPRGRPRRNEASTRRDPSQFERPVPPTQSTLVEIPNPLTELLTGLDPTPQHAISVSVTSVSSCTSVSVTVSPPRHPTLCPIQQQLIQQQSIQQLIQQHLQQSTQQPQQPLHQSIQQFIQQHLQPQRPQERPQEPQELLQEPQRPQERSQEPQEPPQEPQEPLQEPQEPPQEPIQRPTRVTAMRAPSAWAELSPRKRQRRR